MECTGKGQLLIKDAEISSFLPSSLSRPEDQTSQTFNSSMQENELELHDEPLNEFNTPTLAFLAFAYLFPDAKAYPTSRAIFKDIFASDTDSFSKKLKHMIKFADFRNKKWFNIVDLPFIPDLPIGLTTFCTREGYWVKGSFLSSRIMGRHY